MTDIEYNKYLIEKYPFLLPRNVWTDMPIDDYDYSWVKFKDEVPKSWWNCFGEVLCEDLKEILIKYNYLDGFRFSQCKEKYGQLCLYDFGAPEEWHAYHLPAWEYISRHTCCECGKFPSRLRKDNFGWICPFCDDCGKGFPIVIKDEDIEEFLELTIWNSDGKKKYKIDMKPFYDKIGYKYEQLSKV